MPAILLNLPMPSYHFMSGINLNYVNKPELIQIASLLRKYLRGHDIEFTPKSEPSIKNLFKKLCDSSITLSSLKKIDLVMILAAFAADFHNIYNTASTAAPEFIKAWKKILLTDSVAMDEIEEIIKKKLVFVKDSGWRDNYLSDPLLSGLYLYKEGFFWGKATSSSITGFISSKSRETISNIIFGSDFTQPITIGKLPKGASSAEDFEVATASDIIFLNGLTASSAIIGDAANVTLAKVNSLAKKIPRKDFADYGKTIVLSRTAMIAAAYIFMYKNRKPALRQKPIDLAGFARFIVNDFPALITGPSFQILIPYYKGFTKALTNNSRAGAIGKLVNRLIEPAKDNWLDLANFKLRYLCNDNLINSNSSFTGLFDPYLFSRISLERSDIQPPEKSTCTPGLRPKIWDDITWQYVIAYIRLLQAVGILAVTHTTDPTDRLRHTLIRMTPLGRYAFGYEDSYTPEVSEDNSQTFDIDDRNMIVTILNQDTPYKYLFDKIGHKIGGNRYHITAAGIIASCTESGEAMTYIKNLRSILKPKSKSPWNAVLDEAEKRARGSMPAETDYILMRLDPECPGLIDFISTQPEILSNVLLADKAHLLIPAGFLTRLRTLARAAGYII